MKLNWSWKHLPIGLAVAALVFAFSLIGFIELTASKGLGVILLGSLGVVLNSNGGQPF